VSDRDDPAHDQLGLRLDTLQVNLGPVVVGPADRLRGRGDRRRRQATAGALAATLAAVAVLGLGTVRALEPQAEAPAHQVTVVPVPPTPVERADGQADTRPDPSRLLDPGARLVLPDALLGPELLPVRAGTGWDAGPVLDGPGYWAATAAEDHQHCWGHLVTRPVQQAARSFSLLEEATRPELDQVVTLAAGESQAASALEAARRRCSAGATAPVFSPPPGSPPVTQFKNLNGVNGFVYTRDATTVEGVADRPNCEYAVLVQRGALLVLVVLRQRTFSYDLPRSDTIAITLQALDRALAHTTAAAAAG
jgi:hypothetical protein